MCPGEAGRRHTISFPVAREPRLVQCPGVPSPDIVLDLPGGWTQLDNGDGPLTFSPDDGESVLQLSSPSWSAQLRGRTLAELSPILTKVVEGGRLGRVIAVGAIETRYGRGLRAEVESDDHGEVIAWLLVPEVHDVVLATWLAGADEYGETAQELIARVLKPGLFSVAIAAAADIAAKALAAGQLSPHAVLFGDGEVTRLALATLPHEIWDAACRVERANVGAQVVVQVLAATARKTVDVAMIYAESATRRRKLVVGDGAPVELEAPPLDLFAAPDPRLAAALAAARR